jgi:ubiquinone/menaquinone biosynthesis C-methylase UbiE
MDYSELAIRMARRKARLAGLKVAFVVGDVTRENQIRGPFDLALDIGCFHTVRDRKAYLTNLSRLVSGGGHWLVYAFLRLTPGRAEAGLGKRDLGLAESFGFKLQQRTDGLERPGRPSAWFLFERISPQH